jgi:hypothetical protein
MLNSGVSFILGLSVALLCLAPGIACSPPSGLQAHNQSTPTDWRKIQTAKFSFSIPPDMEGGQVRATDSSGWEYSNGAITLSVQYGPYADPLQFYVNQPHHEKAVVEIGGVKAEQHTFYLDEALAGHFAGRGKYIAAVHFANLGDEAPSKLSMWANCESPEAREVAKKILNSLKFN